MKELRFGPCHLPAAAWHSFSKTSRPSGHLGPFKSVRNWNSLALHVGLQLHTSGNSSVAIEQASASELPNVFCTQVILDPQLKLPASSVAILSHTCWVHVLQPQYDWVELVMHLLFEQTNSSWHASLFDPHPVSPSRHIQSAVQGLLIREFQSRTIPFSHWWRSLSFLMSMSDAPSRWPIAWLFLAQLHWCYRSKRPKKGNAWPIHSHTGFQGFQS